MIGYALGVYKGFDDRVDGWTNHPAEGLDGWFRASNQRALSAITVQDVTDQVVHGVGRQKITGTLIGHDDNIACVHQITAQGTQCAACGVITMTRSATKKDHTATLADNLPIGELKDGVARVHAVQAKAVLKSGSHRAASLGRRIHMPGPSSEGS